jgi:hypothetical protein
MASVVGPEAGATGLREGVPGFLQAPLRDWVYEVTEDQPSMAQRIRVRAAVPWDRAEGSMEKVSAFLAYFSPAEYLLDTIDATLALLPGKGFGRKIYLGPVVQDLEPEIPRQVEEVARRRALQQLLDDARSVCRVRPDGNGLERRASAVAVASVNSAVAAAEAKPDSGSAARHLRAALDAVRSLHPDPEKAYSQAIKAVEAAAHAVAQSVNARATLGTMRRMMRDHPEMYELAIPGPDGTGSVAPVVAMMSMLWEGQTSRHGGQAPTRPETLDEAEMAVQLAATLVEWFATGKIRRR